MFYGHNILHMWLGQFILILLYEHIGFILIYLGGLILKHVMFVKLLWEDPIIFQ